MSELTEHLTKVMAILRPMAEKMEDVSGRTVTSCLSTLILQELKYIEHPSTRPKDGATMDGRFRKWKLDFKFWEISEGMARGTLLAESEEDEVVTGMDAVCELIREYTAKVHEIVLTDTANAEFAIPNMLRRLGGMRPAISRGGGLAHLKIHYDLGTKEKFYLVVGIRRYK